MNFLNPLFLVALAATAVPLLIHIFSRRRVPEVPFSTLRFLKRSDRRSMRRINFRRLLLLILRMAAIALVALAFARPVVRGGLAALFPAGGDRSVCVLLDRSYSMRVEEDEGTLFRRAADRAAEITAQIDRNDEVSVILFDDAAHTLYAARSFDREVVIDALGGQEPSWHGTDLRAAVRAGWDALSGSRREVRELYIVSDFQRAGIRRTAPDSADGSGAARAARVFLAPVSPGTGANVSVEEILTPRVALHRGELARLGIKLKNNSRDLEARFPLGVAIDGVRIIEKEIALPPGGARIEEVSFPVESTGWLRGEVRKGPDRLSADDVRYFALNVRDRVSVLLVADEGSFYLEQALSPEGTEGDIALEKLRWSDLTTGALDGAEAVVLGPGGGPAGSDVTLIRRFVESGGTAMVLILPGLEPLVRGLSAFRVRIDFRRIQEGFVTIEPPRGKPPFLAPFDEDDIEALTELRFRAVPSVQGVARNAVILRFQDGSPFLWRERIGDGSVVFAAIDPRLETGDLVLSPYFLPLIQQAILAGGPLSLTSEGGYVGAPVRWNGPFGPDYRCILPGGAELRYGLLSTGAGTEQAGGRLAPGGPSGGTAGGGGAGVVITPPEEPGFITMLRGEEIAGLIAVNPDCRRESDLASMTADEAADSLGIETYQVLEESTELAASIYHAREGREISTYLILAAIALFVIELIVAQRTRETAGA